MSELPDFTFKTVVRPNGSYGPVIKSGDDTTDLDQEMATRLAFGLMTAIAIAEYDAAVAKQMVDIADLAAAQLILTNLRERRGSLNETDTHPLKVSPGVNQKLEPFLHLQWKDGEEFQWSVQDAKWYALYALEVVAAAAQDTLYHDALVTTINIDSDEARIMVADLAKHR